MFQILLQPMEAEAYHISQCPSKTRFFFFFLTFISQSQSSLWVFVWVFYNVTTWHGYFFWYLEVSKGLLPSEHFDIPSLLYQKDPSVSKMLASISFPDGKDSFRPQEWTLSRERSCWHHFHRWTECCNKSLSLEIEIVLPVPQIHPFLMGLFCASCSGRNCIQN